MFKDYNLNQVVLSLDLERNVKGNDVAFVIHHLIEQIPDEGFAGFLGKRGVLPIIPA